MNYDDFYKKALAKGHDWSKQGADVAGTIKQIDQIVEGMDEEQRDRAFLDNVMYISLIFTATKITLQGIKEESPLYDMAMSGAISKAFLLGLAAGLKDDGIPDAFKRGLDAPETTDK